MIKNIQVMDNECRCKLSMVIFMDGIGVIHIYYHKENDATPIFNDQDSIIRINLASILKDTISQCFHEISIPEVQLFLNSYPVHYCSVIYRFSMENLLAFIEFEQFSQYVKP